MSTITLAPYFYAENPFSTNTIPLENPGLDECTVLRKLNFSDYDADEGGAFYHLSPGETILVPVDIEGYELPPLHPLLRVDQSRVDTEDGWLHMIRITNLSRNSRVKIYSGQVIYG